MSVRSEKLELIWARVRHGLSWWLSATLAIIGLITGIAGLVPVFTTSKPAHELAQSIALAAITVVVLGYMAVREYAFSRRGRLASTVDRQQAASERLRDLCVFLTNSLARKHRSEHVTREDLSRARKMVEEILDEYANIFSLITATRCRACVKLITYHDGKAYVFALARDRLSSNENRIDDKRREDELLDPLEENTDFYQLFDPKSRDTGYFFSNNLPAEDSYSSTSFNYWENVAKSPNKPRITSRSLPYKSAIVYPVRQEVRDDLGIMREKCVGFLAFDSASRWAFARRWDVPLGKALANNMYMALEMWSELDRLLTATEEKHEMAPLGSANRRDEGISPRNEANVQGERVRGHAPARR